MPAETDAFPFTAVPWLPPFRLTADTLLDGEMEVTHSPAALFPFALLRPCADPLGFLPHPAGEATALAQRPASVLRGLLDALAPEDRSPAARRRRWLLDTALAAAEATAALRALGDTDGWIAAAAARRGWYLRALEAGQPPPADAVASACRAVPQALRHLGKALPTAEAIGLLAPLGRICELGAGFGLFARALERAGLAVAASDPDTSANAGVAFPVRRGFDAAATLDVFAAQGALPPLLIIWPDCAASDWCAQVFACARAGQLIALASPEVEFCAAGGLAAAEAVGPSAGAGWQAAAGLAALLGQAFEQVGVAPVMAAGWPVAPTPLRLWRRR